MSFTRYDSSFIDPSSSKRFDGTNWVDISSSKRFEGGNWIETLNLNSATFKWSSDSYYATHMFTLDSDNQISWSFVSGVSDSVYTIFRCTDITVVKGDIITATGNVVRTALSTDVFFHINGNYVSMASLPTNELGTVSYTAPASGNLQLRLVKPSGYSNTWAGTMKVTEITINGVPYKVKLSL